jgi:hypothetical protein
MSPYWKFFGMIKAGKSFHPATGGIGGGAGKVVPDEDEDGPAATAHRNDSSIRRFSFNAYHLPASTVMTMLSAPPALRHDKILLKKQTKHTI